MAKYMPIKPESNATSVGKHHNQKRNCLRVENEGLYNVRFVDFRSNLWILRVVNVELFEVFGGLGMNCSSNSCSNDDWWLYFP